MIKTDIHDDTPLSLPEAADYLTMERRTFSDWVSHSMIWQSAFFPAVESNPRGKKITTPRKLREALDRLSLSGQMNVNQFKAFVFEKRKKAA